VQAAPAAEAHRGDPQAELWSRRRRCAGASPLTPARPLAGPGSYQGKGGDSARLRQQQARSHKPEPDAGGLRRMQVGRVRCAAGRPGGRGGLNG